MNTGIIVLIGYTIAILGIALYASKRMKKPSRTLLQPTARWEFLCSH